MTQIPAASLLPQSSFLHCRPCPASLPIQAPTKDAAQRRSRSLPLSLRCSSCTRLLREDQGHGHEGGGRLEQREAAPHGSSTFKDRSIIPDWASLPPELVEGIADRVFSATGGDAYMDMRAVCPSWRSAIAKPSPLAAFADHRFRPRHWVMLDLKSKNQDDDARLFFHATTGRFRRVRLPVLRDHLVLGVSEGLIILRDKEDRRLARVLDPLTGGILHFAAPLLLEHLFSELHLHTAVSGGPHSTLLVWQNFDWRQNTVIYAHPTSAEFTEEESRANCVSSMVTFQGNIYYADFEGSVNQFLAPAEQCDHEVVVIAEMPLHVDIHFESEEHNTVSYLVESAGELLLIWHCYQTLKVFRVDVEHKLLEEVKSLSSCRALFLGKERCVSVDADKLPSVDGDCIYMFYWEQFSDSRGRVMHVYNLRDNTMEIISNNPKLCSNNHPRQNFHENPWDYPWRYDINQYVRPLSLIQVLLDYCNDFTEF